MLISFNSSMRLKVSALKALNYVCKLLNNLGKKEEASESADIAMRSGDSISLKLKIF